MSASEKLKELDGAATKGPWGVYEDVEMSGGEPYPFHRLTNDKGWLMSLDASDLRKPDAHLMAALRSALPQIVALVEAAEELVTYAYGGWQQGMERPRISQLNIPLIALREQLEKNDGSQ